MRWSVPVWLVVVLCAGLVEPAWSGRDGDGLSQKIERERQNLQKLKSRIQEEKQHADAAERQRESVLQNLQQLDQRVVKLRQERQEVTRQVAKKDQEITDLNGRLAELRGRTTDHQEAILARARLQYIQGQWGPMKLLLAAQSYSDFQRRFQYLSTLSRREYALVESYRTDMTSLEVAERQRALVREEMVAFQLLTDKKIREIRDLRSQKRQYLKKVTYQKESYQRAVDELERSAGRVDSLLNELEQRRKLARAKPPTALPGAGRKFKGALPWPVQGEVVSAFGRQKHPTFETYIQRKGIEIRSAEGSTIKCVMPGTVVYADWLKGYGQVVIVDHQNGYFSLYAHASKLLANVGDRVETGQALGETGDTGMTGDSTLYFELREGAEAVDPLLWLAKR